MFVKNAITLFYVDENCIYNDLVQIASQAYVIATIAF